MTSYYCPECRKPSITEDPRIYSFACNYLLCGFNVKFSDYLRVAAALRGEVLERKRDYTTSDLALFPVPEEVSQGIIDLLHVVNRKKKEIISEIGLDQQKLLRMQRNGDGIAFI